MAPAKKAPTPPPTYAKPTACELDPKQAQQWEMTRAKLLWHCPAFSHVFYTMMKGGKNIAVFTKDVPIAATDGSALMLNPDTFFNYTIDERLFIVCHEILHGIFNHMGLMLQYQRTGKVKYQDGTELPYDHELMNKAMDYVINDILVESQCGSFNKDWLHDTSLGTAKDSVIDVYKKVYKQGGGGQGMQFDIHMPPGTGTGQDPTTADAQRNEHEWKAQVAAGVAAAKTQGKLPAGLERVIGEMLDPQVDWREHIRSLMARRLGSNTRSWRKLDRRLITRGIGAPGKTGFGTGVVVVGADTSGSIGQKELDMFFAEIAGILEDVRPEALYIVWCDAAVHRVDEAEEPSDLNTIRCKGAPGGGGTSFIPVFDEIDKMGLKPEALVYLTDGMGTFPSKAPSYPVIWGNIYPGSKYPFGDVVEVPKQA